MADAGPDVDIQLPVDSITLSGNGSYDDKEVVQYSWELSYSSDSDAAIRLVNEDTEDLDVEGLAEGEYEFKLTVYDIMGLSDEDFVKVTVRGIQ